MSMPLLEAYAQQLPKLEARESLRRQTEIAVGTGSLKADEQQSILNEWEQTAGRAAARPKKAQLLAQLEAMGLEVVRDG